MQITDRSKDVIKSGGEWISSIDLENAAVGCPGVAEAAAIGMPHPKWDERPLLVIVKKPGAEVTKDDVLDYLQGKIAKWWMPDDVAVRRRNPAHGHRQDFQAEPARAVQGLRAANCSIRLLTRCASWPFSETCPGPEQEIWPVLLPAERGPGPGR
jgi:acyl-CoA synthetase (AMP-forming)/AMP-acid ligase II